MSDATTHNISKHTSNNLSAVLAVEQVKKSYGPRIALNGVTLDVKRGEFVALLGPNGAGKSTLFQLLSGLFVVDAGSIQVLGQDIRNSPVKALAGIGIVFQQATLDLDLNISANLRFHARLHGLPGKLAKRRIAEELERLELTDRATESARSLSGGNRRKVELARALVHDPAVLLMDEATVGLDPASRRQLLDNVLKLCQERDVGVLWATHLVDEAERADRVIVLHEGNILTMGTPAEIVATSGADNLANAFLGLTGRGAKPAAKGAGSA